MRLFVGIWPSLASQNKITEFINQTQLTYPNLGRWIDQKQIHISVAFLGEVAPVLIPLLENKLATIAKNIPTFKLTITGFVWLPAQQPRLGYLRISHNTNFKKLQRYVDTAARSLKIQSLCRPPHLTVIRCRQRLAAAPLLTFASTQFTASQFELIYSNLTQHGPIYTPLKAFKLTYKPFAGYFRPNIAFCIINSKNELLLVKHPNSRSPYWHLPQGGSEAGEDAAETIRRELAEELGLKNFSILLIKDKVQRYRWPVKLQLQDYDEKKSKYIGQEQGLAIIKISSLTISLRPNPSEIGAICWIKYQDLKNKLPPVRRHLGEIVLTELERLLASPQPEIC